MINKDKYWEKLVSLAHDEEDQSSIELNDKELLESNDYKWILSIKKKLFTVFSHDAFNKNEAKLRLDHRIDSFKTPVRKLYTTLISRAAVIVLALVSGAIIHMFVSKNNYDLSFNEIEVPYGQMSKIKLTDGTSIWLNSGTTLKYPSIFNTEKREVFIKGEAYFEVAKNTNSPFVVNSNSFSVEVLGTSFNLTSYDNDAKSNLTLVEGKVKLYSENKHWSTVLNPGESADVTKGELVEIKHVDTDFFTSWKNGKISFRQESLNDIASKLERWYNTKILFTDESLKALEFSGTLIKNKPVDQVLQSLCLIDDRISYRIENRINTQNIIWISKKE